MKIQTPFCGLVDEGPVGGSVNRPIEEAERKLRELRNQWELVGREVEEALLIRNLEQQAEIVREKLRLIGVKPVA